jgi:voltage-gated potassium channel
VIAKESSGGSGGSSGTTTGEQESGVIRDLLRSVVEEQESKAGKAFAVLVQLLILLSLVSFSLETLPDLSVDQTKILRLIEVGTVALFTLEYLLRIFVARRRRDFVFSFFGLVDLVAILPFYLAGGLDLRALRVLRLLRVFRILKLLRYSVAIRRFRYAFRLAREELVLFFFTACLVLYVSAVGIYYFEHDAQPELFTSIFDALWWSVATLTTVGYGDAYPVTAGGRFFTFAILMVGLGIVAVPSGVVASALSEARRVELGED